MGWFQCRPLSVHELPLVQEAQGDDEAKSKHKTEAKLHFIEEQEALQLFFSGGVLKRNTDVTSPFLSVGINGLNSNTFFYRIKFAILSVLMIGWQLPL